MSTSSRIIEAIVGVLALLLLVLLLNPFMLWMPSTIQYCVVALALVVCALFGGLILREHVHDERELAHTLTSGRTAYLAGFMVLVVGAVYQAVTYMVDIWLFAAIAVMVVVKLWVGWWLDRKG